MDVMWKGLTSKTCAFFTAFFFFGFVVVVVVGVVETGGGPPKRSASMDTELVSRHSETPQKYNLIINLDLFLISEINVIF